MKAQAGVVVGRLTVSTCRPPTETVPDEHQAALGGVITVGQARFIPIFDERTNRPRVLVVLPVGIAQRWRRASWEAGAFILDAGETVTGVQGDPPTTWTCRFISARTIRLDAGPSHCALCRRPLAGQSALVRTKSQELHLAGVPLCPECAQATRADGEEKP